jgi:hypothetical protein
MDPCFEYTNNVGAEPEGSTPLMPKPATGHDPKPVSSTSHPNNLFP